MKRIAAALLLAAATTAAAQDPIISYTPIGCVRTNEMPILRLSVAEKGELRAYFRRTNTTDWCSVLGENEGAASRVMLPKFNSGDEIEYFFVLLEGKQVIARSAQLYRVRVTDGCGETPFARNVVMLLMNCDDNGNGSIPASLGAGYALRDTLVTGNPPYGSPDRPMPEARRRGQ